MPNDLTEIINIVRINPADVSYRPLVIDKAVVRCIAWNLRCANNLATLINGYGSAPCATEGEVLYGVFMEGIGPRTGIARKTEYQ
jgi:hypothetical protein